MKWNSPDGSILRSADGKYVVMQANSEDWIAYAISAFNNTADKLAERKSMEAAQLACDDHAELLRKRA